MQRAKRIQKGFTLLEILLVIAAIGILAAIVLVAINPTKQLAQIRNAQRLSNINTIFKAIEQNTIDTGGAYPGTVGGYKDICPIGSVNTSCTDLSGLVPIYMAGIPVDPRGGNYKIGINPDNNRISVKASNSELGQKIVINEITMKVEYLIIGGGGSGGAAQWGGGGGAGGYRSSVIGELSGGSSPAESRLALSIQSYTVTVGNGGVIPVIPVGIGNSGSSSSFGGITALGGGGGSAGGTWGSGGGAGYSNPGGGGGPSGTGTAGQGTNGGPFWDRMGQGLNSGGGGGGAGTAAGGGGFGGSAPVAFGGAGLTSSITGAPVARAGGGSPGQYGSAGLGSSGPGGGWNWRQSRGFGCHGW